MKVIKKELIHLNQTFEDKNEAITFLAKNAKEEGYISSEQALRESVNKRENEASTAVGYSIAIPHGKSKTVKVPFISFVQTTKPFQWNEGSDEEVQLIFLIGVPEENENNMHLQFISALSKKLLDDEFRASLLSANSTEEAFDILETVNSKIKL